MLTINKYFRCCIVEDHGFLYDCKINKEYRLDLDSANSVLTMIAKGKLDETLSEELKLALTQIGFLYPINNTSTESR